MNIGVSRVKETLPAVKHGGGSIMLWDRTENSVSLGQEGFSLSGHFSSLREKFWFLKVLLGFCLLSTQRCIWTTDPLGPNQSSGLDVLRHQRGVALPVLSPSSSPSSSDFQ